MRVREATPSVPESRSADQVGADARERRVPRQDASQPGRSPDPAAVVTTSARRAVAIAQQAHADRAARIESLRLQVASGRYPVDLGRLADRIASDELARAAPR